MANEASRPCGLPVHASAVAIGSQGLLIFGPSGSGKSRLACALIAASCPALPIRLVGDDRILLREDAEGGWWARAHPRIAGFIERRGLGIVAMAHVGRVRIGGMVLLADACDGPPHALTALPRWAPPRATAGSTQGHVAAVLAWWRDVSTTPDPKPPSIHGSGAKD